MPVSETNKNKMLLSPTCVLPFSDRETVIDMKKQAMENMYCFKSAMAVPFPRLTEDNGITWRSKMSGYAGFLVEAQFFSIFYFSIHVPIISSHNYSGTVVYKSISICFDSFGSSEFAIQVMYINHFIETASETCNDFHPMFFTHDRSFEEFFCICIQLLNKTWKEMRATSEDFNKPNYLLHVALVFTRWLK
ncbi:engulfment and cell motility protein 1 isoform 1 [Cricetulus griseus]|nr:engulfment and cell motility protein 1 isoform 1 [Cricetulus griseus]